MRKSKVEPLAASSSAVSLKKQRSFQVLVFFVSLYLLFLLFQFPIFSRDSLSRGGGGGASSSGNPLRSEEAVDGKFAPKRPYHHLVRKSSPLAAPPSPRPSPPRPLPAHFISGLNFSDYGAAAADRHNSSELNGSAREAWEVGRRLFVEMSNSSLEPKLILPSEEESRGKEMESCPHSITMSGEEFKGKGSVVELPCGLTLGSHITLVGRPKPAHSENDQKIGREGEKGSMVSQFRMELQGLKTVEGEEPPRILHFNPRLKGDWSNRPVIEQNTCYRQQWGTALRCEGWKSKADEETVDGQVKCEKWIRDDDNHSEESKTTWWLNRLIGRTKKVAFDWPFPFAEDKLFVLTLSAGLEGYHVNVDGRHVTSFPYRTGFTLEDATGLSLSGDIDVHSIFAASLPTSHPSFGPQRSLEMLSEFQASPLPEGPIELFVGILSAGNHFAERMAVRKSWMSAVRKSPHVVARFFVAMHGRREVNLELKKEAEYFGDIVIVPYMDHYDLVVLKTVAILEYGIHRLNTKYIMKCDDDTFVRIDAVLKEVKKFSEDTSVYVGNINYYHKPLREGKWAVTYEEWPEEDYPPYANGPGYVVSSDIARSVVSDFEKHKLRLFKMEDVSMGMWVEQFNSSRHVEYVHSIRYCQFGCIEDYLTAHYQSPRQMLCMWDKLQEGRPQCCNMR